MAHGNPGLNGFRPTLRANGLYVPEPGRVTAENAVIVGYQPGENRVLAPLSIYADPSSENGYGWNIGEAAGLRVYVGTPGTGDNNPNPGAGITPSGYVAIYSAITSLNGRDHIWAFNSICEADATADAEISASEIDINNFFADAPDPGTTNHKLGVTVASGGSKMLSAAFTSWAGFGSTSFRHFAWVVGVGNGQAGTTILKTGGLVNVEYGFDLLGATITSGVMRMPNGSGIVARNAANTADIAVVGLDGLNNIFLGYGQPGNVYTQPTWNNGATSFVGFSVVATDTASAADSALFNGYTNGTQVFAVGKGGDVRGAYAVGKYAPGSIKVNDGEFAIFADHLTLTGTQVASVLGTGTLRIM